MDLSAVTRACLRRWYVVLVVVGLAAVGCLRLYTQAEPQYSVTASVVVVPSPELIAARNPTSATLGNTQTPFGNGGATLAKVLADTLNSVRGRAALLPAGTGLAAGWDPETSTLVTLTASGTSADSARAAMTNVLSGASGVLADVQVAAGTPQNQLYVATTGTAPDFPVQSFPDRLRSVVATALAGLVVAVVLAVVLDSLLLRRRPVRHAGPATGGDPVRLPPPGPPAQAPRSQESAAPFWSDNGGRGQVD